MKGERKYCVFCQGWYYKNHYHFKLDDGTKIIIEGTNKEVKRIVKILKQLKPQKEEISKEYGTLADWEKDVIKRERKGGEINGGINKNSK